MKTVNRSSVMVAIVAGLLASARVEAATITGHATVGVFTSASGTINFAVVAPTDPDYAFLFAFLAGSFTPGVGSGALVAGDYLYLYQAANDEAGSNPLSSQTNSVGGPGVTVSSWGSFGTLSFNDTGLNVSASGQQVDCSTLVAACYNDGPGGRLDSGLAPGALVLTPAAGVVAPTVVFLNPGNSIQAVFASPNIASLFVGGIIGYTSPYAPGIGFGSLQDGGQAQFNFTPHPVLPVPESGSTLVLLGLGLVAVATVSRQTLG
jgi:hypothetical protein